MTQGRMHTSIFYRLAIIVTIIFSFPVSASARMEELCEKDLSEVSAQAGINWRTGNTGMRVSYDSYRFSDTDSAIPQWIEFNDITVDDGQGGFFSFDTAESLDDTNTLDAATDASGQTMLYLNLSNQVEPRTYTVGSFVFCDQNLGSIQLDNVRRGASDRMAIGAHMDDGCGIELEYHTKLDIDSITYTYNNQPTAFSLHGIHLSQQAMGAPEDPTSWLFSGKFKLGDLANDRPVTMDVATVDDGMSVNTSVYYNIPMSGTVRVEGVDFGGNNFGPCAIDGITVHHLGIQIPGN